MRRIVVYQSGTGFTAKYAGWIAQDLGCEAKEYKSVNPSELAGFDMVIYGGWILGGMVVGFDKIKALNQIPRDRFFYYEGGYDPKKLGVVKKMMVNMVKKSVEKKENKTADDLHTLETFRGADRTSKEAIRELVAYCQ